MAKESANGIGPEPVSDDPDNRTPFERFEDLAKTVIAVPKAEVDRRREKLPKRRPRKSPA